MTQFGFSGFFCTGTCLQQDTLMKIDFDVLKYIKRFLKHQHQCVYNTQQKTIRKNTAENLDSS